MKTTRRTFLGGVAVASLPVAAVAIPAPETLLQRRDRLVSELVEVSKEITGLEWVTTVSDKLGVVYIYSAVKPTTFSEKS